MKKTVKSICEVCKKEFTQEESVFMSKLCGRPECYFESICVEQWDYLSEVLNPVVGKKLISFNLSSDGGQAILKFENKTVILGAGGNLWDEAYPVYSDDKDKFQSWRRKE